MCVKIFRSQSKKQDKNMRNSTENQRRYRANNPEKIKAYNKSWRERNPEYSKDYHRKRRGEPRSKRPNGTYINAKDCYLQRKYNIDLEEYNRIFMEQKGKCAICGTHQSELKRALDVDHCHKNNKVRGLLCNSCNIGLGHLGDDIENLKCAILYLNKRILTGQPTNRPG